MADGSCLIDEMKKFVTVSKKCRFKSFICNLRFEKRGGELHNERKRKGKMVQ